MLPWRVGHDPMGAMKANVFLGHEHAGVLEKHNNGYVFEYLDGYAGVGLSLSLPVAKKRFEDTQLFPFFKSLLPEGWLLKEYCRVQKIDERDEFSMLINNGEDLLGATVIRPVI